MSQENASLNFNEEEFNEEIDFDALESQLEGELAEQLADLELLEEDKKKIGNPDALGKVIIDEVWTQFGNQLGLDMTSETLLGKYDREHAGEKFKDVAAKTRSSSEFKNAAKEMKKQQEAGNLTDAYTGKKLGVNEKANLDHVKPIKQIDDDPRRQQANIDTADLANKPENLAPTNEALNKSKGAKTNSEYIKNREQREKDLIEQNRKANEKIDNNPNLSDVEKRLAKEKNDKALNDKLAADNELMLEAEQKANKAINKDIRKGVTKEVGKKAAKDALKQMTVAALSDLAKEIMNGLIRFFKEKAKSFKAFLSEMKSALKNFFENLKNILQVGATSFVTTIVTEIFEPIFKIFGKLVSFIKQGMSSFVSAIKYLTDPQNKHQPFAVKVANVGKIITTAIVGGGAIVLGEVLEKALLTIPGLGATLAVEIPLLGSLASIIGVFLASLICGILGAIVLNLIDKWIANRQRAEIVKQQIEQNNKYLEKQDELIAVQQAHDDQIVEHTKYTIKNRHQDAANQISSTLEKIINANTSDNEENFADIEKILNNI